MVNQQFAWQKEASPPRHKEARPSPIKSGPAKRVTNQMRLYKNTCSLLGIRSLTWLLYKLIEIMKFADVFNALNERCVSEYAI